jgi:hypothetical protein
MVHIPDSNHQFGEQVQGSWPEVQLTSNHRIDVREMNRSKSSL